MYSFVFKRQRLACTVECLTVQSKNESSISLGLHVFKKFQLEEFFSIGKRVKFWLKKLTHSNIFNNEESSDVTNMRSALFSAVLSTLFSTQKMSKPPTKARKRLCTTTKKYKQKTSVIYRQNSFFLLHYIYFIMQIFLCGEQLQL